MSNGTVRAANATDQGAQSYCWDCGGCGVGDLLKLWLCDASVGAAQTWTMHEVPAAGETRWVLFASGAGAVASSNCLAAHADGRLERLEGERGRHGGRAVGCFGQPVKKGAAHRAAGVVHRRG